MPPSTLGDGEHEHRTFRIVAAHYRLAYSLGLSIQAPLQVWSVAARHSTYVCEDP